MPNKQPDDKLEPDALKGARPVLRGEGNSDALPPTRLIGTGRIDEFDGVTLLTPILADEIAVSHLPAGEGLKNGDAGAVVDAVYRDRGWVTVEVFCNGKTIAVTDVPLTRLRLIWKAPAATPASEPAQRTAD